MEPDPDLRELFAMQLARDPTLSVRATAEMFDEGLDLAREIRPDVIVFHQPPTGSISAMEAARRLREVLLDCRLVLVSQLEAQLEEARADPNIDAFVMLSDANAIPAGVRRALNRAARESPA